MNAYKIQNLIIDVISLSHSYTTFLITLSGELMFGMSFYVFHNNRI